METFASWLVGLLAFVGLGTSVGAGLAFGAVCIRGGLVLWRRARRDWIATNDLREAIAEWKQRHPEECAKRYPCRCVSVGHPEQCDEEPGCRLPAFIARQRAAQARGDTERRHDP